MYKNALKEDFIRVVENLDGTVESTDTIVKLKTKIENSSTFESDPDFVKTLIQNCIDERVSQNEREVTIDGLCCSEKFLSLDSGNEGKREIVLNRRPELYRGKYRCVQPKINLLKKRRSYACETMFSCGTFRMSKRCLHMMEKLSSSEKL
ncbi:hypothetical protein TNCV_456321 [Trichonephila clavipes]|nr:hypothetical protein TNCV_456321 [Trichonephila clavipes]